MSQDEDRARAASHARRGPRRALVAQGAYYAVTGVAPFVSRRGFEAITGPKREWWLVQTVGALVTVVGVGLIAAAERDRVTPEVTGIAAGCAASLAAIDVTYATRGRISRVYLLDAAMQLAALAGLALESCGADHGPAAGRPA